MAESVTPKQSKLLAALPAADYDRLLPNLALVPLKLGEVVYEASSQMRSVYFPVDSIVSLMYVMENGDSAEIAVVGREGVVGVALFMGGETTPTRGLVQSAGYAYQLDREIVKQEFARGGPLQQGLLRYTQALITQMGQTA